eukprot:7005652-Prymnesium_polylepis.1
MKYQCKLCGSSTVYHSCAAVLRARASERFKHSPPPPTATAKLEGFVTHNALQAANVLHAVHQQAVADVVLDEKEKNAPIDTTHTRTNRVETTAIGERYVKQQRCAQCGTQGAKHVSGIKWSFSSQQKVRVSGDLLCGFCKRQLCDELEEYIPRPPGQPGGYLIVRSRHKKRVSRGDGVTLLWLSGQYLAAQQLSKRSLRSVSRNIV